ncbi:hypothetical protein VP01_5023g2 [Puccinia sorghi]|uniref:Uncharacterized protein n=1 Tax=Puccinia sorghi TaxID=27349 RepID=A0A0L6UNM1_9BASI|nr:hypothetical protein VP01_5023g2 [Puccinia sorghi]
MISEFSCHTFPDLSPAVSMILDFNHAPGIQNWKQIVHFWKYMPHGPTIFKNRKKKEEYCDIKMGQKQEYYLRFRISAQNNPRSLPYKTTENSTLLKENSNRTFVEQLEVQNRIFSAHSLQKPGQNSPENME